MGALVCCILVHEVTDAGELVARDLETITDWGRLSACRRWWLIYPARRTTGRMVPFARHLAQRESGIGYGRQRAQQQ